MTVVSDALSDMILYFRRYVKEGDTVTLPDDTVIDYLKRFVTHRMPQKIQLFAYQRQYFFDTAEDQNYYYFPLNEYQWIGPSIYVDGIEIGYYQNNSEFYRSYPEQVQSTQLAGDGTADYVTTLLNFPIMRSLFDKPDPTPNITFNRYYIANVMISAKNSSGVVEYIVDDGDGNLYYTDNEFQTGDPLLFIGSINYLTGVMDFSFTANIPSTNEITIQTIPYTTGRPVGALFTNNYIKIFPVPDRAYRMQFQVVVTPEQFFNTDDATSPGSTIVPATGQKFPFPWMSDYISLGGARMFMLEMRKEDQLKFYNGYFKELENECLRRSTRQTDTQRTQTLFSQQTNNSFNNFYNQY